MTTLIQKALLTAATGEVKEKEQETETLLVLLNIFVEISKQETAEVQNMLLDAGVLKLLIGSNSLCFLTHKTKESIPVPNLSLQLRSAPSI